MAVAPERLRMHKNVKTDRSRMISLAYKVLKQMESPPEVTTELEMLVLLSEAFLAAAAPEADAPKEWKGTLMFSRLDDIRALRKLQAL
jgi:hypothetical protein